MASIGCKLKKTGIVMMLLTMVVIGTACEDQIDNPKDNPSGEKMMDVALNIGLADEVDGFAVKATPSTKALSDKGAFSVALEPSIATKANAAKPDKLYNLEIVQYDNAGNYKSRAYFSGEKAIGSRLDMTLTALDDCQLVLVAWGQDNSTTLGTRSLSDAQEITMDASVINSISETNMNQMPYVLHLEHVCVKNNAIQSIEGKDVRLLLRRLATRLTLKWSYSYTGYQLKQILLESIPLNYKVVPKPEDGVYPSLLDQFTTIQLKAEDIEVGSYSCWIPANVRGTNGAATSQIFRIKSNAPTGSAYVSFIAGNTADPKKKLNYRVYLGGNNTSDFNLYGNTNYNYTVNITHTALPVNDYRVTIIDPIPASENNDNLVPTANCFMVAPGGAFCFNPYKYNKNGAKVENTLLQGWCASSKIQSVKVLWQTKENGDVGDPVLGIVNSSDDHTNIVDVTNGDDFEKARIYCRVAPNTTGGSGLIAAYASTDGTGSPLWSWHVWVTDYKPNAEGNETVLTPVNKRKLKFTYNNSNQLPMMDRNLGALAGFLLSDPPRNQLDKSKANGLHYQWGRKDPFPSSYSEKPIGTITGLSNSVPPKGMLNRYAPDGITYVPLRSVTSQTTVRNAFQNPTTVYIKSQFTKDWCSETSQIPTLWNSPNDETGQKTFYDPCPAGWRVVSYKHLQSFFTGSQNQDGTIGNGTQNVANPQTFSEDGGVYFYYTGNGGGEATYIRLTGYWRTADSFQYIGQKAFWWLREHTGTGGKANYALYIEGTGNTLNVRITKEWYPQDVHTTRCIQECE